MNASTLLFIYAIILVAVFIALIIVFWGDIVGERRFKLRPLWKSRFTQAIYFTPLIRLRWIGNDNPAAGARVFEVIFDLNWLMWGGQLTWSIITPRPWHESTFWKDKPEKLVEMREQLRLQNEAMANADAKNARKATEKALSMVGRQLAALRPKD